MSSVRTVRKVNSTGVQKKRGRGHLRRNASAHDQSMQTYFKLGMLSIELSRLSIGLEELFPIMDEVEEKMQEIYGPHGEINASKAELDAITNFIISKIEELKITSAEILQRHEKLVGHIEEIDDVGF